MDLSFKKVRILIVIVRHFDSDWSDSLHDMKSTPHTVLVLAYEFFLWCSMKQEIIAQSTIETEFIVATIVVN